MKASRSGSWSEQCRWKAGWLRPSEVPRDQDDRCQTCRHHRWPDGRPSLLCNIHGFSTQARAWCRDHERR